MARERRELTDEQWARPAPLLPPAKPACGRPTRERRRKLVYVNPDLLGALRALATDAGVPATGAFFRSRQSRGRPMSYEPCWRLIRRCAVAAGVQVLDGEVLRPATERGAAAARPRASTRPACMPSWPTPNGGRWPIASSGNGPILVVFALGVIAVGVLLILGAERLRGLPCRRGNPTTRWITAWPPRFCPLSLQLVQ